MTAQQLKNAILQEAIQGRLVPQDPNDEPASALLDRIHKEKQLLVKEGKLKKKDLEEKPISEDEIPFEIPESWEWCRMNSVIDVRDGTHDTPSYVVKGYPLITGKDFYNGYFELSKTQYISEEAYLEICKRSKVDIGDILFSMIGGNIGSQILITKDNYFEMAIKNVALFKQFSIQIIDAKFLSFFLNARTDHIKSVALGGAQSFVSLKQLRTYLIPLPPLAEQKRIVTKIEELLPKVEEYGKAQEKLNKLNEELPERLKKSILQEAIEGRLVPQDPNDEPASALLAKIREEKKQLLKEGKLKKKDLEEKPISEDEIPFEIPESWEWTKLFNCVEILYGYPFDSTMFNEIGWGYPLIRIRDVLPAETKTYTTEETEEKYVIKKGDMLVGMDGNFNVSFWNSQDAYLNQRVCKIETKGNILNQRFLYYYLPIALEEIFQTVSYVTVRHLSDKHLRSMYIPLPPLAEQKRIVAKIEQLFKEIDKLKK